MRIAMASCSSQAWLRPFGLYAPSGVPRGQTATPLRVSQGDRAPRPSPSTPFGAPEALQGATPFGAPEGVRAAHTQVHTQGAPEGVRAAGHEWSHAPGPGRVQCR